MAHELGHYVLQPRPQDADAVRPADPVRPAVLPLGDAPAVHARYGARWGTQSVADVASLPLLAAVFSVFMLAATPVFNTIIRTQEIEADRFGLHLARDPHGFRRGDAEALGLPQDPTRVPSKSSCSSTTRARGTAFTTPCVGGRQWARPDLGQGSAMDQAFGARSARTPPLGDAHARGAARATRGPGSAASCRWRETAVGRVPSALNAS